MYCCYRKLRISLNLNQFLGLKRDQRLKFAEVGGSQSDYSPAFRSFTDSLRGDQLLQVMKTLKADENARRDEAIRHSLGLPDIPKSASLADVKAWVAKAAQMTLNGIEISPTLMAIGRVAAWLLKNGTSNAKVKAVAETADKMFAKGQPYALNASTAAKVVDVMLERAR